MQLTIIYQRYVGLQRLSKDNYIPTPPCYNIFAENEEHDLFIFQSDGLSVTARDLHFVHFKSERSHNSYTYRDDKHTTRIMARPTLLYSESGNVKSQTAADAKLIRAVIEAVTATPVCFPTDDRDGLSQNKVTISF